MASEGWQWTSDQWEHMWQTDDIPWNDALPCPFLDEHEAEMFGGQPRRVFVPLCGKSRDMVWMYERGHTVIGAELSEKGVADFFTENAIPVDIAEIEGVGKLYKSTDGRIQLYAADLFKLTLDLVGKVDVIWDSASITAINVGDNARYIDLLSSFLKAESSWYMYVVDYDQTYWPGPPQSLNEEKVQSLFGTRFTIDKKSEGGRQKKVQGDEDAGTTTSPDTSKPATDDVNSQQNKPESEATNADASEATNADPSTQQSESKPGEKVGDRYNKAGSEDLLSKKIGAGIKRASYFIHRRYRLTPIAT